MKSIEEKTYDKIWYRILQESKDVFCTRIEEALKLLDKGNRLLDVGCGDGSFGKLAKNNFKYIYGVDLASDALKRTKTKGLAVLKVNINAKRLPFKSCVFDTVSCLDVVEHIFEPEDLIREGNRLLKSGGIFIISTPNIRFIEHISMLLARGYFPKTSYDIDSYDGGHIHYFTFSDIRRLLEENGFKILEEKGVAYRPYKSIKMSIFRIVARVWEKQVEKEFFHRGIIIKAQKINE